MRLFYLIPVYHYSSVIIAHYYNNKWTFFYTMKYQSLQEIKIIFRPTDDENQ
jgi:hypothetical protein